MEHSLLWTCFRALGNLERKHLSQWLASPFFCRKKEPSLLFEYLHACLQNDDLPDADAARQFVNAPDLKTFRLIMSELMRQVEHFLVYHEKFEPGLDFHTKLGAAFRKRGLEKHFHRALAQARRTWEAQPHRHNAYFEAIEAVEFEFYQYLGAAQRTEAKNLQALVDATDTAFITRKLQQACFALAHQTVYKAEYDLGLLSVVLRYLENKPALLDLPAVALYYYCFLFLSNPEDELHFKSFKEKLFRHMASLPTDEQRNLHLLAINYCVRKINQTQSGYFQEAFELYRSALHSDLLLENGMLSPFAYNNIIAIALRVQDAVWAESFAHQYAPYLDKKVREANYRLNLARIAYSHKNYGQALLHLQNADYKDLINNLIAKTLQLKIYYETGELDALDAHLQSMQSFLRRHRNIGYHRDNYRNIIRFTRRLMQHNAHNASDVESLKKQIEQASPLTEKEWLLDMASYRRL